MCPLREQLLNGKLRLTLLAGTVGRISDATSAGGSLGDYPA